MGDTIRAVEARQVIRRRVINKPAILSPQKHMVRQSEVGATAVNESGAGLDIDSSEILGIEDQRRCPRADERRESLQRHTKHIRPRHLMRVVLDVDGRARRQEILRVERVSVVRLEAVVTIEKETIAGQHTAAVRRRILYAILRCALHEAAERLCRHFILPNLFRLRKCRRRHVGDARNQSYNDSLSEHFHLSLFLIKSGQFPTWSLLMRHASLHPRWRRSYVVAANSYVPLLNCCLCFRHVTAVRHATTAKRACRSPIAMCETAARSHPARASPRGEPQAAGQLPLPPTLPTDSISRQFPRLPDASARSTRSRSHRVL